MKATSDERERTFDVHLHNKILRHDGLAVLGELPAFTGHTLDEVHNGFPAADRLCMMFACVFVDKKVPPPVHSIAHGESFIIIHYAPFPPPCWYLVANGEDLKHHNSGCAFGYIVDKHNWR